MGSNTMLPTPYSEVNDLLLHLKSEVQRILREHFVGMYLYGSLALGDFDPQKSDIDFLIVTANELPDELIQALKVMHLQIAAGSSKWMMELEGSYIPLHALRRYDPNSAFHPHIDRGGGDLEAEQHHSDWVVQRYSLREHGVVLAGPDIKTLIDPITPEDLRHAVLDLMWWWELQLKDTSRVEESGYQAYTILSMCRVLYTLQHGAILSKPEAARWAQRNLDEQWRALIESALTWQPDMVLDRLSETLDFIRYTIERSRQFNT
jgi:hypothetical protein